MIGNKVIARSAWTAPVLALLGAMIAMELPMAYIARKLDRPDIEVRKEAHRVAMADMLRLPARAPSPLHLH